MHVKFTRFIHTIIKLVLIVLVTGIDNIILFEFYEIIKIHVFNSSRRT